jgi:hypothetical protein
VLKPLADSEGEQDQSEDSKCDEPTKEPVQEPGPRKVCREGNVPGEAYCEKKHAHGSNEDEKSNPLHHREPLPSLVYVSPKSRLIVYSVWEDDVALACLNVLHPLVLRFSP